jgi:hypothetical protein
MGDGRQTRGGERDRPRASFEVTGPDRSWDVVVLGGGPAGTVAAVAAARQGARTLIVEERGFLGGSLTGMGVSPMMTFHAGPTQVVRGIPEEIVTELVGNGWSPGHIEDPVGFCSSVTPFDPEGLKLVLDDLTARAGVDVLFHAAFIGADQDGGRISALHVATRAGVWRIRASVFVDATGDAALAAGLGVPTLLGRPGDGATQPMTMNVRVYGVDTEELDRFQKANPTETNQGDREKVAISKRSGISGAYTILREARQSGEFPYEREMVLAFEGNTRGEYTINMSRIAGLNPVDPFDLSAAEAVGRRQVLATVDFLRKRVPGFANCEVAFTGPNIGVRESRKIVGVHVLSEEDLVRNTMFPDAIGMGGYPIDLHDPDGRAGTHYVRLAEGSWYSIPYRSCLTNEISNLIVTGRCLSATQNALAAVRVTPIVMGFSQGVGVAAAQAAQSGIDVRAVDTDRLRAALMRDGVFLEEWTPTAD